MQYIKTCCKTGGPPSRCAGSKGGPCSGTRLSSESLKKLLKSKEIGEDEEKSFEKNVQTITDKHIQIVDEKVSSKEKEIMTIWTHWIM